MSYDLCIVGGGMFGSAAARHVSANPSLKVCLIGPSEPPSGERKNREIFSSHYDACRITRVLDEDPFCEVLARESIKRYRELEKLSGIKFHTPVGNLQIVPQHGATFNRLLQSTDAKNVPITELPRETFGLRYPYLRLKEDEIAILDDNGAGHIDPRKLVWAQKKVAKLQGCEIIEGVVSGIKLENDIYQIRTEFGDTITAKRVLIATGVFVDTKKFEIMKPLKVTKLKKTVALLKLPKEEVDRLSSLPDVIYEVNGDDVLPSGLISYFLSPVKYPDGNYYLKIAIESENAEALNLADLKQWYLSDGDKEVIAQEVGLIQKLIPDLKFDSTRGITCAYCSTHTGLPYLDRITPTLTVAVGGNGKSAKFSDEIGRIAAQLCITGNWDSELRKDRFKAVFRE